MVHQLGFCCGEILSQTTAVGSHVRKDVTTVVFAKSASCRFPVACCCGRRRVEGIVPKGFAVLAGATSIDY